jgi:hypothetical protein
MTTEERTMIEKEPRTTMRTLYQAALNREAERDMQRKLGIQLINIGYRALAVELHPDLGGSPEGMARLNHARDHLKKFA